MRSVPKILLTDTNRWPVVARLLIAFRDAGCDTAVLCSTPDHPAQTVRGARAFFCYDGFEPINSLRRAIEAFKPDLIVPCCDRSVINLHKLHSTAVTEGVCGADLATLIERSLGDPKAFPVVSSRSMLIEAAEAEGILVPKTTAIEQEADLPMLNSELRPPWVMKADGTWGGQGVTITTDFFSAKQFIQQFDRHAGVGALVKRIILNRDRDWAVFDWRHSRRSVIAQRMIHGRPANCAVVCWEGKCLAGVAVEVIKSNGSIGPATIVQIVPGREMLSAAEKLARRLKMSGFFGLDFMIENNTGRVYLIEMNPRCTPPSPLPLGSGRNLVDALCAQISGHPYAAHNDELERRVIAYFPLGVKSLESENLLDVGPIYRDVPDGEPELVAALLHPKSRRSVAGKFIDRVQRKRNTIGDPVAVTGSEPAATNDLSASLPGK